MANPLDNLTPWKPGQSGNPTGNNGWSTKPISKRIQEYLEGDCQFLDHLPDNLKSKKAKDMLIEALVKKAIGTETYGSDTSAMKLIFEHAEGKPYQAIDMTTKGERISSSTSKLDELIAKLNA